MNEQERKTFAEKVNNVIEQLKPYLQADGGDIELREITDEGTVKVQLTGACGSCPYRLMTLKSGVEQALKKQIPEVKEVISVD